MREGLPMTLRLLPIAILLLGAAPALAQPINQGGGGIFGYRPSAAMESNPSVQGASASVPRVFAAKDLNHDGMISRGEWGAAGLYRPDFDNIDQNHDNKVDLPEFMAKLGGGPPPKK
jgi:hypothetical protein